MSDFKLKLRFIFFIIAPFVITIMAWSWWWLLWMILITVIFSEIPFVSTLIKSTISGFALHTLATVGLLVLFPGAAIFGGWLYPIVFWVICFFLL